MHLFGSIRCILVFLHTWLYFKKRKSESFNWSANLDILCQLFSSAVIENGINYGEYLAVTVLFLRWRVSGGPCSLITLLTAVM